MCYTCTVWRMGCFFSYRELTFWILCCVIYSSSHTRSTCIRILKHLSLEIFHYSQPETLIISVMWLKLNCRLDNSMFVNISTLIFQRSLSHKETLTRRERHHNPGWTRCFIGKSSPFHIFLHMYNWCHMTVIINCAKSICIPTDVRGGM